MTPHKEQETADFIELKGWQGYTPPHMVQIPLEEYRRYIESNIKGPTVEIALQEYDRLKEENLHLQENVWNLKNRIRELESELGKREQIADILERITGAIAKDMGNVKWDILNKVEEVKKIVTDSDTVADRTAERIYRKRTEIKEEAENGRI